MWCLGMRGQELAGVAISRLLHEAASTAAGVLRIVGVAEDALIDQHLGA
jgi:hypothetical protein